MLTKNMSNIVNSSIYKNYMNFISIPFNYIEKYNIFKYKKVINENEKMKKELLKEKTNKIKGLRLHIDSNSLQKAWKEKPYKDVIFCITIL